MMTAPVLSAMTYEEIDEAVALVGSAMNYQEAQYVRVTFERHFAVCEIGSDDGRYYFTARIEERLVGLTGLHYWSWGPKENVWLGWFAVEPSRQGEGIGTWLLAETEQKARDLGFKKLFVETYEHPDFRRAIVFYTTKGFRRTGCINDWLTGGEAMLVFMKEL